MKRFKILACRVLYREISLLSYASDNVIDVTYLKPGLHDTPEKLFETLQKEIDLLDAEFDEENPEWQASKNFDAILLGYGLCSNAVCNLSSKRYKLVIPRAHDCITLFLGSKEKYAELFSNHSGGIYWYTRGWNDFFLMPGKERVELMREHYVKNYGEDNADYLMEMEQGWMKEYNRCVYVDWEDTHSDRDVEFSRQCAKEMGWEFETVKGDCSLLKRFIAGDWNEEDFLMVQPGQSLPSNIV